MEGFGGGFYTVAVADLDAGEPCPFISFEINWFSSARQAGGLGIAPCFPLHIPTLSAEMLLVLIWHD